MDYSSLPKFPGESDRTPDRREPVDRGSAEEVGAVLLATVAALVAGSVLLILVVLRTIPLAAPLGRRRTRSGGAVGILASVGA